MQLHCLGIPHTITSKEYLCCAFTQKVLKFLQMMTPLGYHTIHYGHERSEVEGLCSEHVTVTTDETLRTAYGEYDWKSEFFKHGSDDHAHTTFYKNTLPEIQARARHGDLVLCFWGWGHKPLADQLDDNVLGIVEPGIGYPAVFSGFRCFESYAKMNETYGELGVMPSFYDAVIPNYFDPDDFEYREAKGDYFLFLGRLIRNKGVDIAIDTAKALGAELVIAGQGSLAELGYATIPEHVIHVGSVGVAHRKELLAGAKALLAPTYYNEPFGGVTVEAMLSGTPVICTDWGAFPENIVQGVTGYRCRNMEQFIWAARNIETIQPRDCYEWAMSNFTLERVGLQFDEWLRMVHGCFVGKGFYGPEDPDRGELDWMRRSLPHESIEQGKRRAIFRNQQAVEQDPLYERALAPSQVGTAPAYVEEGHLGGHIAGGDSWTWEPDVWQLVADWVPLTSVADVGCGEGHAAKWFHDYGCRVIAIDGSEQAVQDGVFPVVQHDYTTGPLKIGHVDMVYACEFVEHVPEEHLPHVLETFRCGQYVMMTYAEPGQPGHHHVNCQPEEYWIRTLEGIGFTLHESMTQAMREKATRPHFQQRGLFFAKA